MEPGTTSTLHRLRPLAPAAPDVPRPPVAEVVGVPLALTAYERTMDWMDTAIARNERAIVTAAAVHLVMVAGEDPETREAICREDVLAVPDGQPLVWAGTGQPKQEKWMADMRADLRAPILAGVGAAFDFHAGLIPQAPGWMQALGLEWTFRLAQEPRRLWRRYVRYNPLFMRDFAL